VTADRHPDATQLAEARTCLAAERTLFAALRTGLAIAGGGSLVVTLLGDSWPYWVQVPLVAAFVLVGYGMTIAGLRRYRAVLRLVGSRATEDAVAVRTMMIAMGILQLVIVIVAILFLFDTFSRA
jgi:uncharacterized membrane protein YidH (DUF202 family)